LGEILKGELAQNPSSVVSVHIKSLDNAKRGGRGMGTEIGEYPLFPLSVKASWFRRTLTGFGLAKSLTVLHFWSNDSSCMASEYHLIYRLDWHK
jgi:hypothetical protein